MFQAQGSNFGADMGSDLPSRFISILMFATGASPSSTDVSSESVVALVWRAVAKRESWSSEMISAPSLNVTACIPPAPEPPSARKKRRPEQKKRHAGIGWVPTLCSRFYT